MTAPQNMSDDAFLTAFLDCSMPPAGFDHSGHVRIAWILLRRHALNEAIAVTCDGIKNLAQHLGVPGKYHRTLTEALVRLMASRQAADTRCSWQRFVDSNPDLMTDAKGLLAKHYSDARMAEPEARSRFIDPDRLPLPL